MIESGYLNDTYLDKVKKIPGFSILDDKRLRQVLRLAKVRRYMPGEVIITEGALDCWVYFLIQGEVLVRKGPTELSRMRRLGDVFGEMGVIDGEPRSATVEAADETMVLALDASIMERPQNAEDRVILHAVLYRLFAEKLTHRLRQANEEIEMLKKLRDSAGRKGGGNPVAALFPRI